MSANLSPEYRVAEEAYRKARDPEERLLHLREMLRTVPKHKGTERIQADIKTRIKQATDEQAGPKKGGARGGPALTVRSEGAAQVALLGPPNSGKSTLHVKLTGSQAEIGPYPFTTRLPMPGMLLHEDVPFQLVDLPPVSADFMEPWIPNSLQPADAALLIVDLTDPECVEHVTAIADRLGEKRIALVEHFEPVVVPDKENELSAEEHDPFAIQLPTLLVVSKCELLDDPERELEVLGELAGVRYPALAVSAQEEIGIDRIAALLFDLLGVVRIYSKLPGKPADMSRPFTIRRGDTVHDVARLVHRGLAGELKSARLWGEGAQFDGQLVGRDHQLADRDVLELAF